MRRRHTDRDTVEASAHTQNIGSESHGPLSQGETEQEPGTRAYTYRRRITLRGKSFGRSSQFLSPSYPPLLSSSPSSLIQLHPSRSLLVSAHYTEFLEEWIKIFRFMGGGIKMKPSTEVVFCVDLNTRRDEFHYWPIPRIVRCRILELIPNNSNHTWIPSSLWNFLLS